MVLLFVLGLCCGQLLESLPNIQAQLSVSTPGTRIITIAWDVPWQSGIDAQQAHTTKYKWIPRSQGTD